MQEGKRNREVFNEHEIALLLESRKPVRGGGRIPSTFFPSGAKIRMLSIIA